MIVTGGDGTAYATTGKTDEGISLACFVVIALTIACRISRAASRRRAKTTLKTLTYDCAERRRIINR